MKKIRILIALSALLLSANGFGQFAYTDVTYDMSVPLGNTSDFISKTSFRGMTLRVGRFVTDDLAVDVRFSWNTFYEAKDFETYTSDDGTTSVTGKQFKYINSFPLTAGARYVLNSSSEFSPYFAGGLGAYKINERVDMGIYYNEDKIWHFGLYPEIGFIYDFSYSVGLNVYARYDYAFKTQDATSHSYIAFGIGLHFGD
jgi:hypothetical protein